jgi:hypothetical protein
VFENGGGAVAVPPASGEPARCRSRCGRLPRDPAALRRSLEGLRELRHRHGGERAVFGARGEVFSVPAKHGEARNLSRTPDAREHSVSWSPDGRFDRLPVRRLGRVRALRARPGRQRPGRGGSPATATSGASRRLVAGWPPLRLRRQAPAPALVNAETGDRRDRQFGAGGHHPVQLVAGQPLRRLRQDRRSRNGLDLAVQPGQCGIATADAGRDQRVRAGLRPGRPLPVLPVEPRLQPDLLAPTSSTTSTRTPPASTQQRWPPTARRCTRPKSDEVAPRRAAKRQARQRRQGRARSACASTCPASTSACSR